MSFLGIYKNTLLLLGVGKLFIVVFAGLYSGTLAV
jgi:hypothetical protein